MKAVLGVLVLLLWTAGAAAQGAPAQPPSDPPSDVESMKAELEEMRGRLDQLESAAATAEEPAPTGAEPLRVYGFMDFGFDKLFIEDPQDESLATLRPTTAGTFVFGNLNLYFDARPVPKLHALAEIRFSLAPHGEETSLGPPLGTSYERVDSVAFDFSSPSMQSQLRLGSIYIERAIGEYSFNQLFTVQWGLFLTPFGIWNLDHGSPTLISLMLPTFIAGQMVPTRLAGVNLYGSAFLGSLELGYALYITNGRNPTDYDLTEDKAFGGRVFVTRDVSGFRVTLGSSGYVGRYVDKTKVIAPRDDGNIFDVSNTIDYNEEVVGFDGAVDIGSLRLRSEGVLRWVHYADGLHERSLSLDGSIQYLPNRLEIDWYALAAYRTPWIVEPFVEVEYSEKPYTLPRYVGESRWSPNGYGMLALSFGLNFELTSHTLLKLQYVQMNAQDKVAGKTLFQTPCIFARVVTSF